MQDRQHSLAQNFINDSGLQIEIAGRYLLLGMNPYSTSYVKTDLAKWDYHDDAGGQNNPALYTNIYPPLLLMASAVEQRLLFRSLGWSDIRFLYLGTYVLLISLALYKWKATEKFIQFLAFVLMNPFFISSLVTGTNDIVVYTFLVAAILCIENKKGVLAGITLGLAVGTKQTAWIALPFILYYIWKTVSPDVIKRFIISLLSTVCLIYVPFLLWNPSALINSILLYSSTNSAAHVPSHPIEGIGFSLLLPALHIVPNIYSKFPFWIFELSAFIVGMWGFSRLSAGKLKRSLWSYIAVTTAALWFFSTYFLPPYLAYVTVLFATAYLWQ
jgi:uncharacterized membrane protein